MVSVVLEYINFSCTRPIMLVGCLSLPIITVCSILCQHNLKIVLLVVIGTLLYRVASTEHLSYQCGSPYIVDLSQSLAANSVTHSN